MQIKQSCCVGHKKLFSELYLTFNNFNLSRLYWNANLVTGIYYSLLEIVFVFGKYGITAARKIFSNFSISLFEMCAKK